MGNAATKSKASTNQANSATAPFILTAHSTLTLGNTPTKRAKPNVDYSTRDGFLALYEQLSTELQNDLNLVNGQVVPQTHTQDLHSKTADKATKIGTIDTDTASNNSSPYGDLPLDAPKHIARLIEYNVPKGKLNRGLTVVQAFKTLKPRHTQEELRKAGVLGWCIEWIQAAFLVADDVMDNSTTRRGQPCWYKNPEIGVVAINDTLILLSQYQILVHKYFANSSPKVFISLLGILTETVYQTELGQTLDLTTQPPQSNLTNTKTKVDLDLFTEERYDLIVKYKTAFYSFYAPIALAMVLAGPEYSTREALDIARSICLKMGRYFQIQDDYLDCYGAPELIGKVGTDIQDNKCSWLVVQALTVANDSQKKIIKENYGIDKEECIEAVKAVYRDLDMEKVFRRFEEESYTEIKTEIDKVQKLPVDIFLGLLAKIYKRDK